MEIAVGLVIGLIIAILASKKRRGYNQPSVTVTEAEHKRLQQVDEEMITVILPTINNDK